MRNGSLPSIFIVKDRRQGEFEFTEELSLKVMQEGPYQMQEVYQAKEDLRHLVSKVVPHNAALIFLVHTVPYQELRQYTRR